MYYKTREKLGQGGFAEVYKAVDEHGNEYALKRFAPAQSIVSAAGEDSLKKRFRREVRHQESINHPQVVQIIDSNLDNDPPFFVMELGDGTLKDYIESGEIFTDGAARALFGILAGLEVIHESGFVHRDLKPANVLKFEKDGNATYKISDFGLISHGDGDTTTLTGTGDRGGTAMYAPPELMTDFKRATAASDIYSFGAILHDIYAPSAKRIPYTELSAEGEIGRIIAKCTKRQARRRYSNVAELREDLYAVIDTAEPAVQTAEEQRFVNLLNEKTDLTEDEWDEVFDYIDSVPAEDGRPRALFQAFKIDHLEMLSTHSPELFTSFARDFCAFARECSFDFEYCDVLGDKLKTLFRLGSVDVRAESAAAALELGVSHNRWYVERIFTQMLRSDSSDAVAERFVILMEDLEFDLCRLIIRLEQSINYDRKHLHPVITKHCGEA